MADNTFFFEVLTPEHSFFSGEIEALTFMAKDGEWTILKNHAPMIVVLQPGVVKIKQDGQWREAISSEGYMEVTSHGVVLFARTCERPEDVDRNRAERARLEAQEALRQSHSQAEFRANQARLARAMARLRNTRNYTNI
ncbi:MAG TPA: ATP synthase F1 subunit epsilon [Candidatus Ventricola intestinavium]|nr:ATP synthase F1 subunit epsilon [Candidatus Ventricola intestinavium]